VNAVSVGAVGSERQIINVANATNGTDAVNLSQLQAMGANVTSGVVTNAFVAYDDTSKGKVTFGGTGATKAVTLTNVANGVANSDAVNVAQLQAMGGTINSSGVVTNAFVAYDDTTKNTITLQGTSGSTKITGLTAGTLSATSLDAVNGTQLYQTNASVANVAGNVTNVTNTVNNIVNGGGIKYFHTNSSLADSSATGTNAVAIGGAASASANNSVALGSNSVANRVNAVSVGAVGSERQIINVANATNGTDAVNLSQLQAMGANVTSGVITNSFVAYDDTTKNTISLKGTSGSTKITALAAGTLSAASLDAINGSQLYRTATSVANALGGGSSVGLNGAISAPSYQLSNGTYADVGSALTGLDGEITSINNNIADTTKYIKVVSSSSAAIATGGEAVAIGGGAYASGLRSLAIGSGARSQFADSVALGSNSRATAANTISVGDVGSERRIMNVANGVSTSDAATFGQLTALQTSVAQQLAAQSSGVKSMLLGAPLGATPVDNYIAISTNITSGLPATSTDNAQNAMAIGPGAMAQGVGSVVIGAGSGTFRDGSTVVGSSAVASAINATVIGEGATTNTFADNSVAIGYMAAAQGADALALGSNSVTNAANSVGLGANAVVTTAGTNSMALGSGSTVSAANAVAIGASSMANRGNTVSVGAQGSERQIVNVAAGTENTDAVNVAQMNAAINAVAGGGAPNAVVYDTSAHTTLTLNKGGAAVALTNVATGQIVAGSKDAVNGSQLYNVASSAAAALGGGATVGSDGKISTPSYKLNGNTYSDVGAALIAAASSSGGGSPNAVVYDTSTHDKLTLGFAGTPVTVSNVADGVADHDAVNVEQLKAMGATIGTSGVVTNSFVAYDNVNKGTVTFGGVGSTTPVILANVGDGAITSTSKQAINGSQLYGAMSSTAAALGGGSTVSSSGQISKPTYTVGSNSYSGVDSAIGALNAAIITGGNPDGVIYNTPAHDKLTLGGVGSTTPVTVANVAAATSDDQAVNLKQLKEAGLNVDTSGNVTNTFIAYDDATKSRVTFGGVGSTTPVLLKNVAAGMADTDAVNVGQMHSYVDQQISVGGGGTANGVAYDDSAKSKVTLGGVGSTTPVTLTNVAAGTGATDAVNYGQFSALENVVANLQPGGSGSSTYVNINTPASGGITAVASGTDSIAIGNGASASGQSAIAIGKNTVTTGDNSVAMGAGASAPNTNAVALGANSTTDRDNSVSVGSAGAERQITNVAAGTQGTDAVNLNQLNSAMGNMSNSINNVDRSAAKGIASASALNIVTPYLPGRTTLNAGVANYRGYQAVGLGVSRWNEKGTINYNLGVSTSGGNSTIVRAGIGIVLGN
jgi:autotransporter adhesin